MNSRNPYAGKIGGREIGISLLRYLLIRQGARGFSSHIRRGREFSFHIRSIRGFRSRNMESLDALRFKSGRPGRRRVVRNFWGSDGRGSNGGIERAGLKRGSLKRAGPKRAGPKRVGPKRAGLKRAGLFEGSLHVAETGGSNGRLPLGTYKMTHHARRTDTDKCLNLF